MKNMCTFVSMHVLCKKCPECKFQKINQNVNFKSLRFNKTKVISALTLKFGKSCNYVITKRYFKKCYKSNVFLKKYNKNF